MSLNNIIQLGNTNWILAAFVGALLGVLLPVLGRTILFGFRMFTKDQIEGTWYNHFFSYTDSGIVFKIEIFEIRKGFRSKFSVTSRFLDTPEVKYSGKIRLEKNFYLIELSGKSHLKMFIADFQRHLFLVTISF